LIVDHEVTHVVTDLDQLATLAQRAQDTLAMAQREAVADMGYYNGEDIKKCLDDGIVPYSPKPNTSANSTPGLFGKEDCLSEATKDGYR
jgi:hypothetical protein